MTSFRPVPVVTFDRGSHLIEVVAFAGWYVAQVFEFAVRNHDELPDVVAENPVYRTTRRRTAGSALTTAEKWVDANNAIDNAADDTIEYLERVANGEA